MLAVWAVHDIRWTADRFRQAELSLAALRSQSVEQRISESELGMFYPYISRVRDMLIGNGPVRLLLVGDPELHKFFGWRSKYQLLPHAAALLPSLGQFISPASADYVLFLGEFDPSNAGLEKSPENRMRQLPLADSWRRQLELVDYSVEGVLFRVKPD